MCPWPFAWKAGYGKGIYSGRMFNWFQAHRYSYQGIESLGAQVDVKDGYVIATGKN
jgi:hypothetical protein